MKKDSKYSIDFAHLKDGVHDFAFEVGADLIPGFSKEELKEVDLSVSVQLEKKHGLMSLDFSMDGTVGVVCDRCLEVCTLPVDYETELYVREMRRNDDDAENLIFIEKDDLSIDLTHFIYESIIVSLPLKRVHPLDDEGNYTCTGEIAKLVQLENDEESSEDKGADDNESIDPRWEGLKNIKFD